MVICFIGVYDRVVRCLIHVDDPHLVGKGLVVVVIVWFY